MEPSYGEIDLSVLTKEARKMLFDFYQFLVEKYGVKKDKERPKFQKFLSSPIKVENIIVPSRDELHER